MKFSEDKKNAILHYIFEKISQNTTSLSKKVSETFDVNQSTIHSYITDLLEKNIIMKVKRGEYKLVTNSYKYILSRKNGDLDNDLYALEECLSRHISGLPQNVQGIWNYVFSEMVNNVMDHSAAETATIHVIQDYINTTVILSDNGVGIFKKLKDYFGFPSIDETICELFKGKLTTDSMNHSGEGIFFSSKLMDSFYIISSGNLFTNNKYAESKYEETKLLNNSSQSDIGTTVVMKLSNFSIKEVKDIFNLYEDSSGRFTKTILPLKNIFKTSPVSRSQAKRVCNNLDKFKEVIIDFDEITWMGQGFAHQLFVVFTNNHPETKIIPINMNEDVQKMYNHAIL